MHCTIAIPKFKDGLFRKYMQSKYTASLRRAGAKAVWIETDDLDKAIQEMLACDGLLLSGGEDVNPSFYGQTATEKCGKIVPARDHAEMKMLEAFLSTGKPILGICRGEQLMNILVKTVEITRFPSRAAQSWLKSWVRKPFWPTACIIRLLTRLHRRSFLPPQVRTALLRASNIPHTPSVSVFSGTRSI